MKAEIQNHDQSSMDSDKHFDLSSNLLGCLRSLFHIFLSRLSPRLGLSRNFLELGSHMNPIFDSMWLNLERFESNRLSKLGWFTGFKIFYGILLEFARVGDYYKT